MAEINGGVRRIPSDDVRPFAAPAPHFCDALTRLREATRRANVAVERREEAQAKFEKLRPEGFDYLRGTVFHAGETLDDFHARVAAERDHLATREALALTESGLADAKAKALALMQAEYEALAAVMGAEAPTLADVITKLELAREHGLEADDLDGVVADLRRMSSQPSDARTDTSV